MSNFIRVLQSSAGLQSTVESYNKSAYVKVSDSESSICK